MKPIFSKFLKWLGVIFYSLLFIEPISAVKRENMAHAVSV